MKRRIVRIYIYTYVYKYTYEYNIYIYMYICMYLHLFLRNQSFSNYRYCRYYVAHRTLRIVHDIILKSDVNDYYYKIL